MPTIKQKTVGGRTYELKQYRTDRPGKQYEYYVTEDGSRVDDPVFTREEARQQFSETVRAVRRAEGEERSQSRGPSLPGMGGPPSVDGGPRLPGFGTRGDDTDDDEDSGFRFPDF